MFEKKFKEFAKFVVNEWRSLVILGLAYLLLAPFGVVEAAAFPIGLALMAGGVSHLLRKVQFPYINLKSLVKSAQDEKNVAAAGIVVGILFLLATYMVCITLAVAR